MPCSICGTFSSELARTGRGESFSIATASLRWFRINTRHDLAECPECKALFHWYDDSGMYGSGCSDTEFLVRYDDDEIGRVMRSVVDGGDSIGNIRGREATLFSLDTSVVHTVFDYLLSKDRALAVHLTPWFLEYARKHDGWGEGWIRPMLDKLQRAAAS